MDPATIALIVTGVKAAAEIASSGAEILNLYTKGQMTEVDAQEAWSRTTARVAGANAHFEQATTEG